jgi:adenylate cyclase
MSAIEKDLTVEKTWEMILTTGREYADMRRMRHLLKLLPRNPRCRICNAPFEGLGGTLVKVFLGKQPARVNPLFCNDCEVFARKHPGGAEIELAMLFADIRGSTALAEKLGAREFSNLIDRFFRVSTDVLVHSDGLIEKLIGDEVAALYVPGFAGAQYAQRALQAARQLLEATGHGGSTAPWVPIGVGVHQGRAFVGAVGSNSKEGVVEFTALGDAVNVAARLASLAGPGEILASEKALLQADWPADGHERRLLELKGRNEPIGVRVLHADD